MATSKRDYYEVLGVGRGATATEIKKSFRKKAMKFHPDVNKDAGAEDIMKELSEAYEVLSDDQKRAAYDRYGHSAFDQSGGGAGFGDFDISDIFEGIFNNFGGGGNRRRRHGPRRGADLRYDMTIDFEEAVFGVEKKIEITRPSTCTDCRGSGAESGTTPSRCQHCNGSGEVRRVQQSILGSFVNVSTCPVCEGSAEVIESPCKTCNGRKVVQDTRQLTVKVPAGVDNETQIRLTNEGAPGVNGGPTGNLYVVISVQSHDFFQRRGNDIVVDLEINIAQAALGAEVAVPIVGDESESLRIPAGTQTGKVIRLRNKGVPYLRTNGRGDQLVVVKVATPTKLTEMQKELFEQLAPTLGENNIVSQKDEKGFFESMKDALFGG